MAQNKQALAQYTWAEQVTISLKGEQKKQEHFQVRGAGWQTTKDFARSACQRSNGGWPPEKAHCREEKGRVQGLCGPDENSGATVPSARQG